MRVCTLCRKLFAGDDAVCPEDDSTTLSVVVEPLPVELAARFRDAEPLALGSTGTLYRVGASSAPQVLKVLGEGLTADGKERARHRRELRKQLSLVHPQLPRVIEEGESEGRVWLLREYVAGESLAVRLRKHGALSANVAHDLIGQLAEALDGLHRLGLSHQDLKPGHVLLLPRATSPEVVQLIDATLAAPLHPTRAEPRGSVDYVAPEVLDGLAATFRSDLYALGCLSYELLTGASPFRGVTPEATLAAQRAGALPELDAVPAAVRALITSLLARDPRRRPFSAQQVRRSIETLSAAGVSVAGSGGRDQPPTQGRALRVRARAAKPVAPVTAPDATVELDVDELDQAIKASDLADSTQELGSEDVMETGASAKQPPEDVVDEDAPTIALNTKNAGQLLAAMRPRAAAAARTPQTSGAPKSSSTGTHFGLGPVRSKDVAAAVAAVAVSGACDTSVEAPGQGDSQLQASARGGYAPVPESVEVRGGAQHAKPVHSYAAQPLSHDPRLILWAAAALLLLMLALRLVRGPVAVATRSDSIVVHVPDEADAPASDEASRLPLSERGLIGGGLAAESNTQHQRRALGASAQRGAPGLSDGLSEHALIGGGIRADSNAHVQRSAVGSGHATAPATAPAPVQVAEVTAEPEEPASAALGDVSDDVGTEPDENVQGVVSTVSAANVGRGLARAAQARSSITPEVDYKTRGRQLYRAGRYREAAGAYQRATLRDGADAGAFAGLGASWLAAGETRRSIVAYQRAVRLQPEVAGFQAALGRAYLTGGDRARARAAYARALRLDPSNQAARSGMASAKAR